MHGHKSGAGLPESTEEARALLEALDRALVEAAIQESADVTRGIAPIGTATRRRAAVCPVCARSLAADLAAAWIVCGPVIVHDVCLERPGAIAKLAAVIRRLTALAGLRARGGR